MKRFATCAILAQTTNLKKENMKTFIVLALDTRRAKADGTYPILLRIIHHEKPSAITTGIYIKETDWDKKGRCIKPSYKGTQSVARLNNMLQKKKSDAIDIITKLEEKKTLDSYTVLQLKEMIEKKPETQSFFKYAEAAIAEMKEANRLGNARAYQSALDAFKVFRTQRDLSFYELNLDFLMRFETAHLKKGKSYNGLSAYLRAIRAIYNRAIKAGIVDRELYPFANYEIKSVKTRKRAISLEAIQRIEKCELAPDHPLYHARNYFLASFYFRGISFADLAELKVSDMIDGRIHYQRKKTDKPYNIKITERAQVILNIYLAGKKKEDFIFPIIRRETIADQYKDIQWARKRFNKKLKKLADKCDIEENLTSYVSRHSFATRAKNLGIPIASISDMLGHENIKTTEVYLDSLPSDILDEMHEKVLQ
jgi:integrase/recombinase XerD